MAQSYEYQFSSTTAEPPTGSQLRSNNADPVLATKLWIRNVDNPGEDVHTGLTLWPAGTVVYVQDYDDHTRYTAYKLVSAPVDKVDYVELPVAWLKSGLPLLTQKIAVVFATPTATPAPSPTGVAYATVAELAAALRIKVTAENTPGLQRCLDAAAIEIDQSVDRIDPMPLDDALANRVNIVRAVEWWKANDAAFGILGYDDTGALRVPRNPMARHRAELLPLKEQWGVA